MRKTSVFLFTLLLSAFVIACSSDDDTSKVMTDAEIVSNSIIDFPSCISSSGDTSKAVKCSSSSENSEVYKIYEGIRQNIGAIEGWTKAIKDVLSEIFNLTEDSPEGDWSNNNPSANEVSRVVWGPSNIEKYETMVEVYWSVGGEDTLGFQAYVTINEEEQTAKGEFIWDFTVANDSENENNDAAIKIVFDGTSDPKTLTIKATGIDDESDDPDEPEPENAWVEASLGSDHIFTMSGNYYFNGIQLFGDASEPEARNYVFTVIGYDEDHAASKCTGSTDSNKAMLNLALPPAELQGTDDGWEVAMWSDYSIGNIYCEKIKEIWDGQLSIEQIEDFTELDLDATQISELQPSEVIAILEWAANNQENANAEDFLNLIFVIKLVNPAYFDANGFIGTYDESLGRGTLDSTPDGFDGLDLSSVDAIAPYDVTNLQILFYQ